MSNRYAGEEPIQIGDKEFSLVFNWRAIAEAQEKLGPAALMKIGTIGALSPDQVATLIEIGLKAKHPDVFTKDDILDASPPIVASLLAIDKALSFAYFGPEKKPAKDGSAPVDKVKGAKKKTS